MRFCIRVSTPDGPRVVTVTNPITGRPMTFASRLEALEFCAEFQGYIATFGYQPMVAPIIIGPVVPS